MREDKRKKKYRKYNSLDTGDTVRWYSDWITDRTECTWCCIWITCSICSSSGSNRTSGNSDCSKWSSDVLYWNFPTVYISWYCTCAVWCGNGCICVRYGAYSIDGKSLHDHLPGNDPRHCEFV